MIKTVKSPTLRSASAKSSLKIAVFAFDCEEDTPLLHNLVNLFDNSQMLLLKLFDCPRRRWMTFLTFAKYMKLATISLNCYAMWYANTAVQPWITCVLSMSHIFEDRFKDIEDVN